jgi:glycosyltransferase involved in cell wall biosynthesis
LEARKGIPSLLKALSLVQLTSDLRLVIVGSGRADKFARIAQQLGVAEKVVFAGYVDDSTLRVAYSTADVLVHASSMEGFGLSIADAVASGLPVVATRVGSVPEVVREGVDGFLVDYGDTEAFADAVTRILENTFRVQGTKTAASSRFTWEKTVSATLKLYGGLGQAETRR